MVTFYLAFPELANVGPYACTVLKHFTMPGQGPLTSCTVFPELSGSSVGVDKPFSEIAVASFVVGELDVKCQGDRATDVLVKSHSTDWESPDVLIAILGTAYVYPALEDAQAAVQEGWAWVNEPLITDSQLEKAMDLYLHRRTPENLSIVYRELLGTPLLIPIEGRVRRLLFRGKRVPMVCIRSVNGEVAIPAFASDERLRDWKPDGHDYIEMTAFDLFHMARSMKHVDYVFVNHNRRPGIPGMTVRRVDFEMLADGRIPFQNDQ